MSTKIELRHDTQGLICRLRCMADSEDEWGAAVLNQAADKLRDMREVLVKVSKSADFSQCPGLEDAVDFVLSGLPNTMMSHGEDGSRQNL